MVKKIIHIADVHIRNYKNMDETITILTRFIEKCEEIAKSCENRDELRIVVAGDLVHSKTDLSPECYQVAGWFLRKLDEICKVIVCAGNHDINEQNVQRLDPLSVIFTMNNFSQSNYIDQELDYKSGCIKDDDIVWCLYSSFDSHTRPNIEAVKVSGEDNLTYVAIFHGELKGSKTDADYVSEFGVGTDNFDGVDFGLLGHIHKRQCLKHNGVPLVYSGSLIQQDFGENISGHGFVLWNVDDRTYESFDIENGLSNYYKIRIDNAEAIDNDKEEIINL